MFSEPVPRPKKPEDDNVIRYGSAAIRWYLRGNGKVSLSWTEGGKAKRTTRKSLEDAKRWAEKKAREINRATGQRWIEPARADRLAWLERIAGDAENVTPLLAAVEKAVGVLGSAALLPDAAALYLAQGPPAVRKMTLHDAVEAFLTEYAQHHPSATVRPVRGDLRALAKEHPQLELLNLSREILAEHVTRGEASPRTVRNRIANWRLFFNRAIALEWWPEAKRPPVGALKRPRLPDKAPEIYTPAEGRALLDLIEKESPQHLPFLLIAGWLGCRPSECVRLEKSDFDFKHRLLHLRAEVVGKTARERWTPIPEGLCKRLKACFAEKDHGKAADSKACRWKSQEAISKLAREKRVIARWIPDGLRHSFITYRLQETGGDYNKVAEEAGNSPAEIRASYRRPIPPGEGAKWFGLI